MNQIHTFGRFSSGFSSLKRSSNKTRKVFLFVCVFLVRIGLRGPDLTKKWYTNEVGLWFSVESPLNHWELEWMIGRWGSQTVIHQTFDGNSCKAGHLFPGQFVHPLVSETRQWRSEFSLVYFASVIGAIQVQKNKLRCCFRQMILLSKDIHCLWKKPPLLLFWIGIGKMMLNPSAFTRLTPLWTKLSAVHSASTRFKYCFPWNSSMVHIHEST